VRFMALTWKIRSWRFWVHPHNLKKGRRGRVSPIYRSSSRVPLQEAQPQCKEHNLSR
jgi:hypothetical protein